MLWYVKRFEHHEHISKDPQLMGLFFIQNKIKNSITVKINILSHTKL